MFDKFVTTAAASRNGNEGLGLYFCRLAVEAHGGRIWVEETAALPTIFCIELPLTTPRSVRAPARGLRPAAPLAS